MAKDTPVPPGGSPSPSGHSWTRLVRGPALWPAPLHSAPSSPFHLQLCCFLPMELQAGGETSACTRAGSGMDSGLQGPQGGAFAGGDLLGELRSAIQAQDAAGVAPQWVLRSEALGVQRAPPPPRAQGPAVLADRVGLEAKLRSFSPAWTPLLFLSWKLPQRWAPQPGVILDPPHPPASPACPPAWSPAPLGLLCSPRPCSPPGHVSPDSVQSAGCLAASPAASRAP